MEQQRLRDTGIPIPPTAVFVTVDFESQRFIDALTQNGFDAAQPAFFMRLGVAPYLKHAALESTLSQISSVPGAEVVFDYAAQQPGLSDADIAARQALRERTKALEEPLQDPLDPDLVVTLLEGNGFRHIDDLTSSDIRTRVLGVTAGGSSGGAGGHIVHAAVALTARKEAYCDDRSL